MAGSKTYVYCNVLPSGYKSPYLYITDFEVKPGDIVIIPLRDREKVGLVIDVNTYSDDDAPFPPEQTKYISRFFKDEETSLFQTQKIWLDGEKVIRQKINDSFQKQTTKFSLLCNGVEKEKMRKSYRYYIDLLKNVGESNKITTALIKNFNCGVELSDDGKTVTGFIVDKNNKTRLPYVRIPYGVEKICSEAIYDRKIDLMFTPDEFKDDEIYREDSVKRIFTEYGNKYFCSDDVGKYRYINGKKYLISLNETNNAEYVIPDDVVGFCEDSVFYGKCRKIVLSKSMEEFNENAISNSYVNCDSHLEIVVPESLRRILTDPTKRSDEYSDYDYATHRSVMINPIRYRIDENNPYLFIDEDSVYQVLDDGTYKLLMNSYFGLGKALILDGTSVIGKYAFSNNENLNSIEFPESVRVIEKGAFSKTSLQTLKIPHYIERIDSAAFSDCHSLKSVTLYPTLKSIAKDAFKGCDDLDKILTPGNNKAFKYKNHNGVKIITQLVFENKEEFLKKAEDNKRKYAWIKGKVFVHTGLGSQEKSEFDSFIFENGGTVRKSTVLNTDYLVYNADYDHETVKLRKARELKEKGSGIEILTTEEWKKLIDS